MWHNNVNTRWWEGGSVWRHNYSFSRASIPKRVWAKTFSMQVVMYLGNQHLGGGCICRAWMQEEKCCTVSLICTASYSSLQVHRKYTATDFDDDLRTVLRRSGCRDEKIVFILDESNMLESGFLERMNTLLANGEVHCISFSCKSRQSVFGLLFSYWWSHWAWNANQYAITNCHPKVHVYRTLEFVNTLPYPHTNRKYQWTRKNVAGNNCHPKVHVYIRSIQVGILETIVGQQWCVYGAV